MTCIHATCSYNSEVKQVSGIVQPIWPRHCCVLLQCQHVLYCMQEGVRDCMDVHACIARVPQTARLLPGILNLSAGEMTH